MKLLAFDVGGTEIKYALMEDALTIADRGYVPTPSDCFDSFLALIREIYLPYKDEIDGIAMCLPGLVDVARGHCGICGAMKYPHSIEVGHILSETCGCSVILENDGKAAALAEHEYGSIQGCQNAAVFLIGTGVGGGLIINNKIVRGPTFRAGEFSFVNTDADHYYDPGQTVGSRCSTTFLLSRYQELNGSPKAISGHEFFRSLPEDVNAQSALDELCGNIAIQLFNLFWLLDLERVAIGGGISKQPILIERIRNKFSEVQEKAMTARFRTPLPLEIVPCHFSSDANLIGACITYKTIIRKTHGKS